MSCCVRMRARSACTFTARARPSSSCGRPVACSCAATSISRSDAAHELMKLKFSAVLSSGRSPMWNAGKGHAAPAAARAAEAAQAVLHPLPPPWDRAYTGRLEDLIAHNEKIVPREATAPREAAMGTSTLVVARQSRDLIDRAKRPMPSVPAAAAGNGGGAPPAPERDEATEAVRRGLGRIRHGAAADDDREPCRRTSSPKRGRRSRARSASVSRVCRSRTSSVRRTSTGASARSTSRRRATRSRSAGTRPATSRSSARPLRRRRSFS